MMTIRKSFLVAATVALAADVVSKLAAVLLLENRAVTVGFLDLRLVHNSGVAFGIGAGLAAWVVVTVTFAVALLLISLVWRGHLQASVATGSIVGGALGNVVDRVMGGSVVDMFDLGWWPAFNVADICIVVGVVLVLVDGFRRQSEAATT